MRLRARRGWASGRRAAGRAGRATDGPAGGRRWPLGGRRRRVAAHLVDDFLQRLDLALRRRPAARRGGSGCGGRRVRPPARASRAPRVPLPLPLLLLGGPLGGAIHLPAGSSGDGVGDRRLGRKTRRARTAISSPEDASAHGSYSSSSASAPRGTCQLSASSASSRFCTICLRVSSSKTRTREEALRARLERGASSAILEADAGAPPSATRNTREKAAPNRLLSADKVM